MQITIFSYSNYSDIPRKINSLQLSDNTIQRRIDELSTNISTRSEMILSNCVAFCYTIDETTDTKYNIYFTNVCLV